MATCTLFPHCIFCCIVSVIAGLEGDEEDAQSVSLQRVLSFFTGADEVPPQGFPRDPVLNFAEQHLPTASTCALELTLPTSHADSTLFNKFLTMGFLCHGGFGLQ